MIVKRNVLITGCSDDSLGSRLAVAFHQAGWRVFASARNLSKLKQCEAAGIETVQLDTLSEESIAKSVSRVRELTDGKLDALVNNAGAGYPMPLMDIDIVKCRETFDLNTFSLLFVTRAFLPLLINSTHGGMIVNNTAGSALIAGTIPFTGIYNASKAAAASLTEALRLELEPFGIKVVNLITGGVRSNFHANAPHSPLPPNSLYNVAKERVEKFMSGDAATVEGADPVDWAAQVVKDLSLPSPSHWVRRGKYTWILRIASLLPVGVLDRIMKPIVGLDEVERKIKEHGGIEKVRV